MPDTLFTRTFPRASYEGVIFPLGETPTQGGHDFAEHSSYGRDGVDHEPAGRKAYAGSLRIPLLVGLRGYDDLFPGTYSDLIRAFEEHPLGTLVHPTKGSLTVAILDWDEELAPGVQSGVWLTVKWREQRATAALLVADSATTATPATTSTQAASTDATAAAANAGTGLAGYTPVAPTVSTQLDALAAGGLTANQTRAAFAQMFAAVNGDLALASVGTVAGYDTTAALAALRATLYRLQRAYLPELPRESRYVVPADMSLCEIAQAVYGDATLAAAIRTNNDISDELVVLRGTILRILPTS